MKMMVNERLRAKFRASSCCCRSVQPSTCSGKAGCAERLGPERQASSHPPWGAPAPPRSRPASFHISPATAPNALTPGHTCWPGAARHHWVGALLIKVP